MQLLFSASGAALKKALWSGPELELCHALPIPLLISHFAAQVAERDAGTSRLLLDVAATDEFKKAEQIFVRCLFC